MKGYIIYELKADPKTEVVVEVDPEDLATQEREGGLERVGRGEELTLRAGKKFEEAIEQIGPIANAVLAKMTGIAQSVNEVQVDFGVKLNAKWGVVVSGGVDVDLKVALKWKKP
jgi:hypothetical protein